MNHCVMWSIYILVTYLILRVLVAFYHFQFATTVAGA